MLKGKTRRVIWNQRGSKCVGWLPSWSPGWLGAAAHCLCPKSPESILPNSTSLEKDKNSKFEVRFLLNAYCFCITVRLKNCKSNQHKSGIVCTSKQSWTVASHAHPMTSRNILTSHHSDSYKIEIRKFKIGSYLSYECVLLQQSLKNGGGGWNLNGFLHKKTWNLTAHIWMNL